MANPNLPLDPAQRAGLNLGVPLPLPQGAPAAPVTGGLNAASELMKEYGRLSDSLPPARAKADKSLEDQLAGLTNYSPDSSDKWMAFAANIAKPTKFGSWGEVATNVAGGLEPVVSKENALKNQYKQLALQIGYQANEKNADQLQSGKLTLLKDMVAQQRANQGKAIVKMDQDGNMVKFDPITETASVIHSSMTGKYSELVKKFAADAVAHGSFPDLDAAMDWAKSKAFDVLGAAKTASPAVTRAAPGAIPQQSGPLVPGQPSPIPNPSTPSDFPRVTLEQQTSRDSERDIIRGKELADATARMNAAPLSSPERTQAQQDVVALKKEASLTPLPGTTPTMGTAIRTPEERKRQEAVGAGMGKRELDQPHSTSALADYLDASKSTLSVAQQAAEHPGLEKATGEQGMIPFRGNVMTAGGTDSAGFIAKAEALKAQAGFMYIQAMKAAAASGASGLGAITEGEHRLLQQQIDTLDFKQKPEEIRVSLQHIQNRIEQMRTRMVEAYGRQYPGMVRQVKGKTFIQGKDGLWNPL